MDIEKLIERLMGRKGVLYELLYKKDMEDAAIAISMLQAETAQLRADLEKERDHRLYAEEHADLFLEDCKRLNAELEQVKRERDAIEQDFRAFTKQWWEQDSGFPCRWCKFENSGGCEWKAKQPDEEKICAGSAFEWRGPQKEN